MINKKIKGKAKVWALFALIATVICAVFTAFAGLFGGFGASVQTASADANGTLYSLGTSGSFTASSLTSLMGKIMGSSTAKSYNELKAYMDKDTDNARTGTEISAQVSLGGQVWNVVYASETRGGDVIATLWLSESDDLQKWNLWFQQKSTTIEFPSNMYATSYIRSYITGSSYVAKADDTTLTSGLEILSTTWEAFVTSYDKYIITPSEVAYQETESAIITLNEAYNYPNEAYGKPSIEKWYADSDIDMFSYPNKKGYGDWQYDKLWLPSHTEVSGLNLEDVGGLWQVPTTVRANIDNTWLRSGYYNNSHGVCDLVDFGSNSSFTVVEKYAVRPAFHLNLKAASSAAGLFVDKPVTTELTKTFSTTNGTVTVPSTTNMTVTATSPITVSGTTATIPANTSVGNYNIVYAPAAGYSWADGSVGAVNVPLRITPATISQITWSETASSVAYTGAPINITATATGAGNLPLIISGDNVNVGSFTVTAVNANPNYVFSSTLTTSKTYSITKKAISVDWDIANNSQFTYDGSDHAPAATFVAANGLPVTLPVTLTKDGAPVTEAVDAGEYVATVAAGDYFSNYNLANAASVSFKINKAEISANDVEWSFTSGAKFATGAEPELSALYRYNNSAYSLTVGITTTDGNTTSWTAGEYTATVSLPAGMDNFDLSGAITRNFMLTESATGNYTVIWENYSAVSSYNGANQTPTAYIISDGEKLAVTVSVEKWNGTAWVAANTAKDAGEYRFTAVKTNYTLLNDSVQCRIDPRVISVIYSNLTGLTHGTTDNVTATTTDPVAKSEVNAGELTFAVTGSGRTAGTHIVSVEAQTSGAGGTKVVSGNYTVSNSTAVQTIGKKVLTVNDIDWTLTFTYDGNIHIPEGKVKASALTDDDKTGGAYVIFEFVYAVNAGNYDVKVLGISNDNYTYSGAMTLIIKDREITAVQWEGVQDGNSVTYNKQDRTPKAYIEIDGNKIYLEGKLEKYDPTTSTWNEVTYAINAGDYRVTVEGIDTGSGNYYYAGSVNSFTIDRYEITAIYLALNVFTYDGNNAGLDIYALGVNNERINIRDYTVTDGFGQQTTTYKNAGNYTAAVAVQTALGSDTNYTVKTALRAGFVINPQTVNVTFAITGNEWSWRADAAAPQVTVSASVANAIEVKYGKLGADNQSATATNQGLSFEFRITGISGEGIITAVAKENYQITGTSVKTFNVIPVDGEALATFSFDGAAWTEDNLEIVYGETEKSISVSGDNDVVINYYKNGVLLEEAITTTDGLDAGTYLITANCPTRELSTNITATTRTFTVLPKEVDFAGAEWLIGGTAVAGDKVSYNGQIYNATLNLTEEQAELFEIYYVNGSSKNNGNVTTTATVLAKTPNYAAINVTESYDWAIEGAEAAVVWNDDGTVASITGDCAEATGGSFFEKDGAAYKVVYKKAGVVLDGAPTEAGEYTAEVVLALGNDGNVNVTASSFSFSIAEIPAISGDPIAPESGSDWLWILLIIIASLALLFAIIAVFAAVKKKNAVTVSGDDDGFYDDVTDEDLY